MATVNNADGPGEEAQTVAQWGMSRQDDPVCVENDCGDISRNKPPPTGKGAQSG